MRKWVSAGLSVLLSVVATAPASAADLRPATAEEAPAQIGVVTLNLSNRQFGRTVELSDGTQVTFEAGITPELIDDGGGGGRCSTKITVVGYANVHYSIGSVRFWSTYNRMRFSYNECTQTLIAGTTYRDGTGANASYVEMTYSDKEERTSNNVLYGDTYANFRAAVATQYFPLGKVWNTAAHTEGRGSGTFVAWASSDNGGSISTCSWVGETGCGIG